MHRVWPGGELIVLTRISIFRAAGSVKKLLVEHFDLAGARTSEALLDFPFPESAAYDDARFVTSVRAFPAP